MKYCIDCKHCEVYSNIPTNLYHCKRLTRRVLVENPVTGPVSTLEVAFCCIERQDDGRCKPAAIYFAPLPEKPKKSWWRRLLESPVGRRR
jgi:hypothetical protein